MANTLEINQQHPNQYKLSVTEAFFGLVDFYLRFCIQSYQKQQIPPPAPQLSSSNPLNWSHRSGKSNEITLDSAQKLIGF